MYSKAPISPVSGGLRSKLRAELAHVYKTGCRIDSEQTRTLTALVDAYGRADLVSVLYWATEPARDERQYREEKYTKAMQVLLGLPAGWRGKPPGKRQQEAAKLLGYESTRSVRNHLGLMLSQVTDRLVFRAKVIGFTGEPVEAGGMARPKLLRELRQLSNEELHSLFSEVAATTSTKDTLDSGK
jgi:hypothetical protein